jgi:hypothetical protein
MRTIEESVKDDQVQEDEVEFPNPDYGFADPLICHSPDMHVYSDILQNPSRDPNKVIDHQFYDHRGFHEHVDPEKRQLAVESLVFGPKLVRADALVLSNYRRCFVEEFVQQEPKFNIQKSKLFVELQDLCERQERENIEVAHPNHYTRDFADPDPVVKHPSHDLSYSSC